jgi:hypothetical protein
MLDNNPLVATGMAICRNITKPVFIAISIKAFGHWLQAFGFPVTLIILIDATIISS